MSAVVMTPTQARRPLGTVSQARLQSLANVQNSQANLTLQASSKSLKRSLPLDTPKDNPQSQSFTDDEDTENRCPEDENSPSMKKLKAIERIDQIKTIKPTQTLNKSTLGSSRTSFRDALSATTSLSATTCSVRPASSPLRPSQAMASCNSPRALARSTLSATPYLKAKNPASAPKSYSCQLSSNTPRRSWSPSNSMKVPFSLDAAIASSLPSSSLSKPKLRKSMLSCPPKSPTKTLKFVIYEDTPEEEASNIMHHSAGMLDISDGNKLSGTSSHGRKHDNMVDTLKAPDVSGEEFDSENKENVAPLCSSADPSPVTNIVTSTRLKAQAMTQKGKDHMTDEGLRAPLGDLNTQDFYPAGCDASSVFIVPYDHEGDENSSTTIKISRADTTDASATDAKDDAELGSSENDENALPEQEVDLKTSASTIRSPDRT